jgi:hypothetical protein
LNGLFGEASAVIFDKIWKSKGEPQHHYNLGSQTHIVAPYKYTSALRIDRSIGRIFQLSPSHKAAGAHCWNIAVELLQGFAGRIEQMPGFPGINL